MLVRSARRYAHHPLVYYVYVPGLLFSIARAMLGLIMPLYLKTFDVPYAVIGLVLACMAFGTILGDLPAGTLQQRWGTKTVMVSGLLLVAGALALQIIAQTVVLVALCQFVAGVGQAMFGVAQHVVIVEAIPLDRRGRANAVLGGVFRTGSFIGPAVAGAIAALVGLRIALWPVAVLTLIAAAFIVRYLPENTGARVIVAHPALHVRHVLARHWQSLTAAGSGFMLAMIVRQGRVAILPLVGSDVLGLDEVQNGLIMSITSAVDMLLFPTAGIIMDRWGRKWAIVPSFVIQAGGMVLVAIAGSFAGLLAAGVLLGLGNGISAGTMMTVGADLAPDDGRGEFLGAWRLIGDLGAAGGPLAVGGIADVLTLSSAAVVLASAGVLAASVFGRYVPETLRQRRTA